MPFPPSERKLLLSVKGVGPTAIARLEQMPSSNVFFGTHAPWAVDAYHLPRDDEPQPGHGPKEPA